MKKENNTHKNHRKLSVLSMGLAFALTVTAVPANLQTQGGFAEAAEPEVVSAPDVGRVQADAMPAEVPTVAEERQLQTITMREGSASVNGLQAVTFVNQNGKQVDLQEESESISGVTSEEVTEMIDEEMPMVFAAASARKDNSGMMGAVRSQGSWGTCWAFGNTAALEANILLNKKSKAVSLNAGELDLAERHMAWFAHNTLSSLSGDPTKGLDGSRKTTAKAAYTGGNYYQALAYLTRGSGIGLEEDAPYSDDMGTLAEADRYDSVITIHDSYEVTYDITGNADNSIAAVKNLVDTYGAAGCSYLDTSTGYSGAGAPGGMAFYQTSRGTNHAVCIVGYDDSYSVDNFTGKAGKPDAPGAWLCRNSWGSSWGNNGYFWISYYDSSLSSIYAYETTDSTDYGDIYQHDATGMHTGIGVNAAANIFQARRDDTLKSVGIYMGSAVANGTIEIYTSDMKMTNPADGTKVLTNTIPAISNAGYHIIDLKSTVNIRAGQYFSIVVTLGNSGATAMYSFEGKSGCKSLEGQSYYLFYGQWYDSYKTCGNACIKALMTAGTDVAELDGLITEASGISKSSLAGFGGDATYNWLQKELKAANAAKLSKTADDVARAVNRLRQVLSQTASYHMYADVAKNLGTGTGGAQMYVNGGKFKKNGVTSLYGTQSFTFSVNKVMSWKASKTGFVLAYNGNYVVAATTTNTKPILDDSGAVKNPDERAAAIVKTKLSGSKVTITPLDTGTVYVWVLYFPKLGKAYSWEEDDYAVTKVTVGEKVPTTVKLYDTAQKAENCTDTTITQYTGTVMPQGGSTSVYIAGTTGTRTKKTDTLEASKVDGTCYEPVVPAKYQDYITITRDDVAKNKFTIQAAPDILDVFKIKTNRTLTVTIPFYCNRNSKKVNFKAVIGNPVKSVSLERAEGDTDTVVTNKAGSGITEVTVAEPEAKKASTAMITETKEFYNNDRDCTDGTKILRMAKEDDLVFTAANVAKVSTSLTAEQKKVSMALQKDKETYKITVAAGTPAGTEVYFVISHNAYRHQSGTGYKIVKVTVGK